MPGISTLIGLGSKLFWGIYGYLAIAALCASVGAYGGYRWELGTVNGLKASMAQAAAQAIQKAKDQQAAQDTLSAQSQVKAAVERQKSIDASHVIVKEVTRYVTPKQDHTDCVRLGSLLLLYAAVHQVDPGSIPVAPGLTTDSCTSVKPSALVSNIISNYGQANLAIGEVKAWREWYGKQKGTWDGK